MPDGATDHPARLGRYRITAILGEGGFGVVYRGYDDDLRRDVAIKVPRRERVSLPEDIEAYLSEARVLAGLDHPNIVPVHDVGRTGDGLCYVVSRFIKGSDLKNKIERARPSTGESAALVATVAEALHYAHRQGLVHRDIKPANILLDTTDKPYVADFGLALKEEDFGRGAAVAGTPAYMSPEQARREGHRVDGRSDIFSLGVVFYELLTGRRPFRGETVSELLAQILAVEARPPRQVDDTIPAELERICLKALSKWATDRYTTARDFAADLRHFLDDPSWRQAGPLVSPQAEPLGAPRIVPKGLRSFDARDADFFLELVPGPRDREGLPENIRFWKGHVEEPDPDHTFAVGLLYGPSGCGKSSLVKAGLLPRLAGHVLAVYVEATADETEARLLKGLRKRCHGLPEDLGLVEALAALRRGQGAPAGRKVLLVLDQFEQWLHARRGVENTELVQALRQCDGGRVQAVVMVRDDFWMAVTRFMHSLEARVVEGENSAAVDLFDTPHARKVLAEFGRSFGRLPDNLGTLTQEQELFLDRAVAGLARDGKVVSVRLALFAEMVKGKPWSPRTLAEVGGTEGVGATFLEETFSAATAPPEHRFHQTAARAVLKALLPEQGTDIKGQMRSHQELLEASGYAGRPRDFEELLRILDAELRLITPTDPEGQDEGGRMKDEGKQEEDAAASSAFRLPPSAFRYYQLTHDYLVPSLRDWLTRKQKETRRGRAELRLAERAALWQARPERRHLPAWWEWANIRLCTRKKDWTPAQQKMMGKAARYHAVRGFVLVACLALLALGSWEGFGRLKARTLRDRLLESTTADVPGIVAEMAPYRRWTDSLLQEAYAEAEQGSRKQLHASLALLPADPSQVEYLYRRLLKAGPDEVTVIRAALSGHQEELSGRLWAVLGDRKKDQDQRFRAACALAAYAPNDARWEKIGGDVAEKLISENAVVIGRWVDALRPVGAALLPPLATFLEDESRGGAERRMVAGVYGSFANDMPEAFTRLERRLTEPSGPTARQVSIGAALVAMGRAEKVWPLLKASLDPTVRSYLIERLGPAGAEAKVLAARVGEEQEVSIRRAIILSLGHFGLDRLLLAERQNLLPELAQLYHTDPDPGIHSAAEWLLRQWQHEQKLKEIDRLLATGKAEGNRHWYVSRQGHTMMMLPGREEFLMGEGREWHKQRIDHRFAIASKEVTVQQFLRFRKDHPYYKAASPTADCPVNSVSWYDAAAYCNWLSRQERIPEDQWCYLPNKEGKYATGMKLAADHLRRTGYRLATEAEWEYACRAGTLTAWSWGESEELTGMYAWYYGNSGGRSHPAGTLKPNDFGLFDMHGNAWEWCEDRSEGLSGEKKKDNRDITDVRIVTDAYGRVLRGGSFNDQAVNVRCANRVRFAPTDHDDYVGIRPARTFR
ncbi:MAG TPA: SUMF1/EgtB/PvdO family nonheme iron enzyme [Gemmataceae bacterium]|nr:SUMF1/EgtB/PvdO family nonheme iron enzyme [Gemmataceae bacterium]